MSQPLRLLQVTKSTAGVAEYVRWLAHGLDPAEFALTVACLSEGGPQFAAELAQIPGVQAFSLAMNRYQIDPLSDARLAIQLSRVIGKGRFDLIHAHASKPGFLARLAAAGKGIPVIYSPHCFSFHAGAAWGKASLLATAERLLARHLTTRIMTVADGEQALAQRYRVGRPDQFVTVHSGIDRTPYQQPVDRAACKAALAVPPHVPLVGAVGRLSAQKSPLDFVRLAAAVHKNLPQVHFVWIGSGPLEDAARQLGNQLGVAGVLHFAGQRPDVPALLQALDCFVLPSLWEGFPIVLLEAMAAGVPVVATDIPGSDEAIRSGVDGWLVPPGDAEALARAVENLLNNPQQAMAFRRSSRQRVAQEFNRQAMLGGLARLYRQVYLENQSVPAPRAVKGAGL